MEIAEQKELIDRLVRTGKMTKTQAFLAKTGANLGHILKKTKLNTIVDIDFVADKQS